jgi:hypothetical protein
MEWIDVKDRLPEKEESVVVHCYHRGDKSSYMEIAYYNESVKDWLMDCLSELEDYGFEVTHWMPIPTPPQIIIKE